MSEKVKQLLIIETAPAVSIQKDNNGNYVFEGIFGEIGVKNKNGRIYDESEYIPQIDLLQEKIKSGTLLGELDHPEKFDVSLSKASHVIESLSYDKDSKKVMGRIRLLNTTSGKEAQALAEGGVPLHISSRAAGVVESNGHVRIKRLFTYDLVADPGFANAQLNRVNEQYGITNNENIHIFEVDEFCNDDTYNKENSSIIMENDNIEFVKINDFEKWSKYISKELTELKTNIHENKNSENNNDISESINTKVNDLLEYVNYLANNVNNLISHNDYIAENVDKVILHLNHVAENANNGINYSEYQGAELEKAIKYIEHVAKGTNQIKEYVDYLGSSTNKIAQYTDYLGEGMNKHVNYTDYLKNNIETVGNYSNHIGEKFNKFTTNSPIISNKVEENKDTQIPENIVKSEIKTGN
ncbi:MAG: S80 family phage morphogenetic serine protease, partial [Atribacterota bacterium]